MKKITLLLVCLMLSLMGKAQNSDARWISTEGCSADKPNSWVAFRRDIQVDSLPQRAVATIAADTKYWLWINGELVVTEGGLKRGPNPRDTYADVVDLTPYLRTGENRIALLLWHFGKEGFSHKNSGRAGLFFELATEGLIVHSDQQWLCRLHPAYAATGNPQPNFRLAESNIRFDACFDMPGWQVADIASLDGFAPAAELGREGDAPWNALVERPIPQWKDFGRTMVAFERQVGEQSDLVTARLPYNMQMTPYFVVEDAQGGRVIGIATDHTLAGGTHNLRAEYVTRRGRQEYESLGWLNGQQLLLTVPAGVEVVAVGYRESGYDTAPVGSFVCGDDFYNRFWTKALRTLYVNMRDNYFDCPDRERAQWWGDVVVLMGESFYTYSISAHALMRKAILELAAWQKPDGTLFSPVPAGKWDRELPGQMLASVGHYGFWNYYMNTGDRATIAAVYPAVKRYLSVWTLDATGLTQFRPGNWTWGDWGSNRDIRLIFAGWHYLALEAAADMAAMLGLPTDAEVYRSQMESIKAGYQACWNGTAYRHPDYTKKTDDRVQALAVLTGIATAAQHDAIVKVLQTEFHASPYMEKYVMEALCRMGYVEYALTRTRNRFGEMVDAPDHTTLFEGWGLGEKGFGGGTSNHAWSGGPITVIAQQLCGIEPLEPGYGVFGVAPTISSLGDMSIEVPTVKGLITSAFKVVEGRFEQTLTVPEGTMAIVSLPAGYKKATINGVRPTAAHKAVATKYIVPGKLQLRLAPGHYHLEGRM